MNGRIATITTEVTAGVTVGIVALPLALAFGAASGVGPAAGLVTAIVAGIVAGICGGSNVQVSGPTGAMVVVLAPIVAEHGVRSVAIVAAMAGIILVIAGLLRFGRVVGFVPWPVIEGFTLGIAVIIAAQQIPSAVDAHGEVGANAVLEAIRAISHPGPEFAWTLAAVATVVVVMVGARAISARLPDSLLAVAVVTTAAVVLGAPIESIGALPDSLPTPSLPAVDDAAMVVNLVPAALAVAALAAIESLLSARVASTMADVGRLDADRELVGQGLASLASGAFGGMPATGAIARTAVNVSAGGRTRLATVVHAGVLVVVVYLLSGLVAQIPLAALAGVLIVVATRMVDLDAAKALLRANRSTALVFTLTAIVTVAFDLIDAVAIGIVVVAFFALRQLAADSGVRRDALPGEPHDHDERIALLTINGPVFFGAAERLHDQALDVDGADVVILRLSQLTMLDATGARSLAELITTLERRGVTVLVKGVRDEDRRLLERTGALGRPDHQFDDLGAAVAAARATVRRDTALPPQFRRR